LEGLIDSRNFTIKEEKAKKNLLPIPVCPKETPWNLQAFSILTPPKLFDRLFNHEQ